MAPEWAAGAEATPRTHDTRVLASSPCPERGRRRDVPDYAARRVGRRATLGVSVAAVSSCSSDAPTAATVCGCGRLLVAREQEPQAGSRI